MPLTFGEGHVGTYRTVYIAARVLELSQACPDQRIHGEQEAQDFPILPCIAKRR